MLPHNGTQEQQLVVQLYVKEVVAPKIAPRRMAIVPTSLTPRASQLDPHDNSTPPQSNAAIWSRPSHTSELHLLERSAASRRIETQEGWRWARQASCCRARTPWTPAQVMIQRVRTGCDKDNCCKDCPEDSSCDADVLHFGQRLPVSSACRANV